MPAWDRIVLIANKYVHVLIMLKLIMSNVEICQQPICKLIPDHNVGVDKSSGSGTEPPLNNQLWQLGRCELFPIHDSHTFPPQRQVNAIGDAMFQRHYMHYIYLFFLL